MEMLLEVNVKLSVLEWSTVSKKRILHEISLNHKIIL
jgi:hypothetical protein